MVSASLLLGVAAAFATASSVSAVPASRAHHSRISIKVHKGNVTVKISPEHASRGKAIEGEDDYTGYLGKNGEDCYYTHDVDYLENDVGNKPAKEYEQCNDICIDFDGCTTWTWNSHNGGTCWLKSHIGSEVNNPGAVSLTCELKPTDSTNGGDGGDGDGNGDDNGDDVEDNGDDSVDNGDSSGQCKAYPDIDFVGNNVGSKPGKSSECCGICEKTAGCSAYAYNNDNGGTCYLKSSVGHVVYKQGVISSSTKPLYGAVCPFEYDTDYAGNDIGNKPAKDAGVCCGLCKENSNCKAYTWSNHNGGTCWMKNGKGKVSKAAGVISATLFG